MEPKLKETQERIVTTDNSLREIEEKEEHFKYQKSTENDKKELRESDR